MTNELITSKASLTSQLVPTDEQRKPGRELSVQQGRYDLKVQLFRDGAFHETYLSQINVGDSFCFEHREGQWFTCVTPIKKGGCVRGDESNPTFIIGSLEVLQARPIAVEFPAPEPKALPSPNKTKAKFLSSDVEDVELK